MDSQEVYFHCFNQIQAIEENFLGLTVSIQNAYILLCPKDHDLVHFSSFVYQLSTTSCPKHQSFPCMLMCKFMVPAI